jgi:Rad3-related DNA helicase
MRRAMADGKHWYDIVTLKTVIQAAGRTIRSENETGNTYILDSAAIRLLAKMKRYVPEWFLARMEAGGVKLGHW